MKESLAALKRHEGEYLMTEFSFWVDYSFKIEFNFL